jgi:hypothetical protein
MGGIADYVYSTEKSGVSVVRGKHVLELPKTGFNILPVDNSSLDSDRSVGLNGKNSQM